MRHPGNLVFLPRGVSSSRGDDLMIGHRSLWITAVAVGVLAAAGTAALPGAAPVAVAAQSGSAAKATPSIIIDSDLSLWWDDATAIGMANVLQQRGQDRILGIMSDIRNPLAVPAIDAIDTAYGHPHIPLGAVAHTDANTAPHGYTDVLISKLPHAIHSGDNAPGAVSLYRRLLADQPNHSVTIVAIGAYTNLAGLLRSKPDQYSSLSGRALVGAKVKRLVIEDGLFPNGAPAVTNQRLDLASATEVVERHRLAHADRLGGRLHRNPDQGGRCALHHGGAQQPHANCVPSGIRMRAPRRR